MSAEVQIRVHNSSIRPTLVYLPGLHGNWKLIGGFRRALRDRIRFVEVTYPTTTTWSFEDYARGDEAKLAEHGINEGWLLGESFSSQVVWQILQREKFKTQGVILAGGFVRHPFQVAVRVAETFFSGASFFLLSKIFTI